VKRKSRDIEVFSLSALDVFASAMGAFVVLSVMMFPYYYKGKEFEEQIRSLKVEAMVAASKAEKAEATAEEARKKAANVDDLKVSDASQEARQLKAAAEATAALAARIEDLRKKIDAETKTKVVKKPTKTKRKHKVTFRFLGLKSDEDRYLILIDGSKRIKKFATNLPKILSDTVSVFGPGKEFAVAFYKYKNKQLVYNRWPTSGFVEGGRDSRIDAIEFMKRQYARMEGESATYQALTRAIKEETDALIFVSDGFIFKKSNQGKSYSQIVEDVTARNISKVQINSVAVGIFYRHTMFAEFMNKLSVRNAGDLKAIPP
jgi:PHP family Zn ribbon phosphoesterase